MKNFFRQNSAHILFICLFLVLAFAYRYHVTLFEKPQSIHRWRQADCASLTLNYYQGGMDFFSPEVHNLTSDQGTSGKCYPSEVPYFYYTVACLYKIFGYHDWIYRLLNTFIFLMGLLYLFKAFMYFTKDFFWSAGLPLLFFCSPILIYYGNSYPINTTALSFSFIAWYHIIRFFFEKRQKSFYFSLIFFLLAAALKVTALISLAAFAFIYALELTGIRRPQDGKKTFPSSLRFVLWVSTVFAIVLGWLKLASIYNQKHDCTYFSTTAFPIWELDREDIQRVLDNFRSLWLPDLFYPATVALLLLSFIFLFTHFKKIPAILLISLLVIIGEAAAYVLLQFRQFADHDYYYIDLYIIPVLTVLIMFYVLHKNYPKALSAWIPKIIFTLFLAFNIYYAKGRVDERYFGPINNFREQQDIYSITPYLRQIGIGPMDTVISIPDMTNVSLYLMNQKGWTEYTDARLNRSKPVAYNADSAGVRSSINKGAKYLILNGIEELYKKPYLQSFATCLVGKYNNVYVFKLKDKKDNFSLHGRSIKVHYSCDAERIADNREYYIGLPDTVRFGNGTTQSDSLAHNGKHACKLNKASPYGMTLGFKNLVPGESFVITAWRKMGNKKGGTLVASIDSTYYNNEVNILAKTEDGWEKITKEIFITKEMEGKELVIYLYSEDADVVFFDDLDLIRYDPISF